jgi:hypothetical protein
MPNTFNLGNGNWAQKTEKLLAYNAENDNYKPLPFDFDRASTATRVNKDGLIETVGVDEPRIDFLNNTKGHLLLEPSRTNLVTYSEDFSTWNTQNFTSNSETTTAPNGDTVGGYDFGDGFIYIDTANLDGSSDYTNSIYIKANKSATIALRKGGAGSGGNNTDINLTTNWVRFTATSISTSIRAGRLLLDNRAENGYGVSNLEVFIWGAQLEQGNYPTSYIPTSGSAVTRSAETCNNAGNSNIFNDSEGVLYAEIASLDGDEASRFLSVSNSQDDELVRFILSSSNQLKVEMKTLSGSNFTKIMTVDRNGDFSKVAIQYKSNDYKVYLNGISQSVTQNPNTPSGLNQLAFNRGGCCNVFYGNVKCVAVFKEALTDEELIALTS